MRDDVTLWRGRSLAEPIPRMVPIQVIVWCQIGDRPCANGDHVVWHLMALLGLRVLNNETITKTIINTLRPRQNGRHYADDIFKCIFLNENAWLSLKISLKFVPKVQINNIPALVQIMAWRRPGDKPLSEPMMVSLLTHICVTRPQWVKFTTRICYFIYIRL